MDVHVRDLRYFVTVAEELHFTRAAERLFVSQPALSKQIRMLETQLRVKLFERDKRRVLLTDAGTALLGEARELVRRWDTAQRLVADAAAAAEAVLRVGIQTSVGRDLLPPAAARFAERRPNWRLQFRQVGWSDPTAGLADESTDVAVVWLPLPDDSLSSMVLVEESRWVGMARSHRLAGMDFVPFVDLLDEPFLALPQSAGVLRDYWLALDERAGRPLRIGAEVETADETLEALINGAGVVLVSSGNAALYERPGVVFREVSGISSSRLALAWRTNDHRAVIRDFVTALSDSRVS